MEVNISHLLETIYGSIPLVEKIKLNPCVLVNHFDPVKCTLSHWKIILLEGFQVAFLPACFSIQFKLQLLVAVVPCCSECWHYMLSFIINTASSSRGSHCGLKGIA